MIEILDLVARAGGGGSGGGGGGGGFGGGGSGSGGGSPIVFVIVLIFIVVFYIYVWRQTKITRAKKQQQLDQAAAQDPVWQTALERAKTVFLRFQQDWSDFNLANMANYLTLEYQKHMALVLAALQQMGRQDKMSNVVLHSAALANIVDSSDNTQDSISIDMRASAVDELIDVAANEVLQKDTEPFEEIWNFVRQGDNWMLSSITQTTIPSASTNHTTPGAMQLFATENGFYYNADFGWLLLPVRGVLFSESKFGTSDINYHVIGQYNDVLVQFYEYVPKAASSMSKSYVIAQTVLPKSYGDIVVSRRRVFSHTPRGMVEVKLEGVDFNKDYLVYASDADKVNSLELLNPSYMAKLLDLQFEVNIEVVDNNLYLYSSDKNADFQTMLTLIKSAFDEMKM